MGIKVVVPNEPRQKPQGGVRHKPQLKLKKNIKLLISYYIEKKYIKS